jgi:hypothetical protein
MWQQAIALLFGLKIKVGFGDEALGAAVATALQQLGDHRVRMAKFRTAPLCGKPISAEDRKVWQQAIALLFGLKL